jgi:hypothetical protein
MKKIIGLSALLLLCSTMAYADNVAVHVDGRGRGTSVDVNNYRPTPVVVRDSVRHDDRRREQAYHQRQRRMEMRRERQRRIEMHREERCREHARRAQMRRDAKQHHYYYQQH